MCNMKAALTGAVCGCPHRTVVYSTAHLDNIQPQTYASTSLHTGCPVVAGWAAAIRSTELPWPQQFKYTYLITACAGCWW